MGRTLHVGNLSSSATEEDLLVSLGNSGSLSPPKSAETLKQV